MDQRKAKKIACYAVAEWIDKRIDSEAPWFDQFCDSIADSESPKHLEKPSEFDPDRDRIDKALDELEQEMRRRGIND